MIGKYKRLQVDEAEIRNQINLQVMARFKPGRVNIPAGWTPRNAYERHLVELMEKGK